MAMVIYLRMAMGVVVRMGMAYRCVMMVLKQPRSFPISYPMDFDWLEWFWDNSCIEINHHLMIHN